LVGDKMPILTDLSLLDTAIMERLSKCIIDNKFVPVTYINPEEEFMIEEFPSIVFYRTEITRGYGRLISNYKLRDNFVYSSEGNLIQMDLRDAPLAIDVIYIIRLYYQYQEDGMLLNNFILKTFPPPPIPCYITVDGEDYDFFFESHSIPKSLDDKFGKFEGAAFNKKKMEREFCEQYIYWCAVDLDLFDRKSVKTVQEIKIRPV